MPKNSLFRKYFTIFCTTFVLSIIVLGIVLLVFASQYFREEKYGMLERNASQAASFTANNYASNFVGSYTVLDGTVNKVVYSVLAGAVDAEIFFVDQNGEILISAGAPRWDLTGSTVSTEVVALAMDHRIQMTNSLGGLFEETHYIVGVPVRAGDVTIGALFAASTARDLQQFLVELAKMFLISAAAVVFMGSVVIYIVTMRMVRPLKDMLWATQSFSQGDFSKRVPVGSYDEIGQLAMAFNNMASTLAATEQTRRSFIANVSHELKTPMTTIGGFVDGILDGTVPPEKRDQYLQVVSNEVKRLARLVRSMLDTARIEAGEMQLNPVCFDISETIRQTVFTFEQHIEEKKLEIKGLDVDKIMVCADVDLMHQVIYNLVENAVKFVNEGGYISFQYRVDNQRTYVAIRNSGAGLDKDEAPQLFERFYKSDKSRSLNKNGVGLGLHIVKSIVNYHRGEITVRSAEGEYTEFEFHIPSPPKKEQQGKK